MERRVPLLRYLVEVTLHLKEAGHSKLPDAFPARPEAARQPSFLQSMQMFCDCLTRDRRAGRKAPDGQGPSLQSLATRCKRVSSPNTAKMRAA
jgi:hypothetical protein